MKDSIVIILGIACLIVGNVISNVVFNSSPKTVKCYQFKSVDNVDVYVRVDCKDYDKIIEDMSE